MVDVRDARLHGARALRGRARTRPDRAQPRGRRRRRLARAASSSGRARISKPADRTRRSSRSMRPARTRAARTLYCTLEPCSHVGRTGPCVERIVGAGIKRVVVPIRDPNPRVSGAGVAYLRAHGVDVTEGIGDEQARRQNAPFLTWITRQRPLRHREGGGVGDGFVGRSDTRVKLTGAVADRYLHRQRAEVDAIAVGSGTVLIDDPLLTARGAYRYRPLTRVIFDWRGQVPAERAGVLDARCGAGHNDRVGAGGGDEPGAARVARAARRADRSARRPDAGAAAQVARRSRRASPCWWRAGRRFSGHS